MNIFIILNVYKYNYKFMTNMLYKYAYVLIYIIYINIIFYLILRVYKYYYNI